MIRRILVLGAAMLMAVVVHAQAPSAEKLAERLNVSMSTAEVVADVLGEIEQKPGFLWSAAAELSQRLTAEQKEELLAARAHVRQRGARGELRQLRAGGVMPNLERFADELELTPEQRRQVADLHARHGHELHRLVREFRAGEVDRDELRQLQRELVREAQRILTPAQQARAEAMLGQLHGEWGVERRTERRARDRAQRRPVERHARHRDQDRRAALAGRADARAEALELTEEQRARLEEIAEARRSAIRERAEEQRAERRAVLRGERPVREAWTAILTEEQRAVAQLHRVLARAIGAGMHR